MRIGSLVLSCILACGGWSRANVRSKETVWTTSGLSSSSFRKTLKMEVGSGVDMEMEQTPCEPHSKLPAGFECVACPNSH